MNKVAFNDTLFSKITWLGFGVFCVCSLFISLVLNYISPKNFPYILTCVVAILYFVVFWNLMGVVDKYFFTSKQRNEFLEELFGSIIFVMIGFVSGSISTIVWWWFAGIENYSLIEAMFKFGFIGMVPCILILTDFDF